MCNGKDVTVTPRRGQNDDDSNGAESGWGESSVGEVLELLQRVHTNPEEARARGAAAAQFIRQHYTWPKAVAHMAQLLAKAGLAAGAVAEPDSVTE